MDSDEGVTRRDCDRLSPSRPSLPPSAPLLPGFCSFHPLGARPSLLGMLRMSVDGDGERRRGMDSGRERVEHGDWRQIDEPLCTNRRRICYNDASET